MSEDYPERSVRLVLAVVVGAGIAAVGGVILGEYPFTGIMPYLTGVLFALVVAEVMLSIGRQTGPVTGLASAVCTVGGLGWAIWISTGRGVSSVPTGAWAALVIGGVVALVRGGVRMSRSESSSLEANDRGHEPRLRDRS